MAVRSPAHLQVNDVSVTYNHAARPALEHVTFGVPEGMRVAVVGPNGAGKSTLFKALVGLLPIQRGEILIHGVAFGAHQECVAYVPQREQVDWRFPVNVQDVVMMGRYGALGWFKQPGKHDRAIVARCLEQMGIAPLAARSIDELSGGQQQRVFLARALAQEPHILLMDEPFTGVDTTTQAATLTLLDELKTQRVTLIVSTHDLNLAATHFDRVLLLNHRVIAYGAPAQTLTSENLLRAFGARAVLIENKIVVDECCPPEEERIESESE
ncbi:metal ABC transporter ATP-binding protein [Anaerolineae bacterium CFX7]|nr:metal ABC transporter ATP-binding protein [Anaerolineae bacterium CFX7]